MKNYPNISVLFVFLFAVLFAIKSADSQNLVPKLELASHWDGHTHDFDSVPYNSLWGWTGNDGREYAILGSLDSIYFFDVTNPYNIKLCDARAGRANDCKNREFKTYRNYCYAVGDCDFSSLQVFDLKYLPDSVHKVYDADTISSAAHSLFIDGNRLYLSYNKRIHGSEPGSAARHEYDALTVASLQNPEVPSFIANLYSQPTGNGGTQFEYVHDLFVRNDTAYCCCGFSGMFIYNYKDSINPVLLQTINNYQDAGYNHSCWLSPDGNRLVFTDEDPGLKVKLYDVSALKNNTNFRPLKQVCLFASHPGDSSTGHNAYMKGNLIYMSYYEDGVVVFDMSDYSNVHEIASYDTYQQNSPGHYHGLIGCWNVYPYFPSGTIIASDMQNGLFVLKMDSVSAINSNYINSTSLGIKILQNPFRDNINLIASAKESQNVNISLYDMVGKKILSSDYNCTIGNTSISIPCPANLSGELILTVSSGNSRMTRKLVKMGAP